MRNIRLIVAYDGTELQGYQKQTKGLTVQGILEESLSKVCNEPITVYGASRTDAGVHAKYQVVVFRTTGTIPTNNLLRALIAHMPPFIVVKEATEIPLDWKPRWSICGKEYIYTICRAATENPLTMRYHWHVKKELDLSAMREAAFFLQGTHDFTTFRGMNSTPANPVKTLYKIAVVEEGEYLRIHVLGDGFLYHMVRNIAGYLVEVGFGKYAPSQTLTLVEGKNRKLIGKTAPAKGLCLEKIFFTEEELARRCRQLTEIDNL